MADLFHRRRRAHREAALAAEDARARKRVEEIVDENRRLRVRLERQWPEIIEGSLIAQRRLTENGFTDSIASAFTGRHSA